MAKYEDIEVVPQASDMGSFIAQCGPAEAGRRHYLYFGIGAIVFAIACFIAPYTFLPPQKPSHEGPMKLITMGIGLFFVCLAALMILAPILSKPQVVFLFENGLIDRRGDQDRVIKLSDIASMKIFEWYEHRYADRELNILLKISGQKDMRFGSALQGDADAIIEFLQANVQKSEFVPFQA